MIESRGPSLAAGQPLVLEHSWPLFDQQQHFDLGCMLSCAVIDRIQPAAIGELGLHHAGCWECDLEDESLTWSGGVFDIFGLPRGVRISRSETLALYCEESRARLEQLRSYAIRHKRGFTLDVDIRPVSASGGRRMRLIGAPVLENEQPVRLHGLKLIV